MRSWRIALLCGMWAVAAATAWREPRADAAIGPVMVTVSAVNGTDRNLSNAVAETLITDLAKQPGVRVVENSALRHGARARYRVVGSCLSLDRHVLVSVRVVDAATWTTLPGLADSVLAPRDQMVAMVDALAQRLFQKLAVRFTPARAPIRRSVVASRGKKSLVTRLPVRGKQTGNTPSQAARLASARSSPPVPEPAPAAREAASAASGVDALFAPSAPDPAPPQPEAYTGLIIDARGCHLDRSMTPRIRLMDGSVLWAGEDAPVDFAIENGVVAYARTLEEARQLPRAGVHPLVVRAVAAYKDAFHSDPVLRDEDAQTLRPHLSDGFMRRFNVVFVVD